MLSPVNNKEFLPLFWGQLTIPFALTDCEQVDSEDVFGWTLSWFSLFVEAHLTGYTMKGALTLCLVALTQMILTQVRQSTLNLT